MASSAGNGSFGSHGLLMYAKWPSASICVPCWPGSALACITSLLNACAENGTPEVALYCVPAGLANGDLGIVLLRTNEAS